MNKKNEVVKATIRPIHYLGSKLRMLEAIKSAIDDVDPSSGDIVDLFSGSGTVTEYMSQFRNVAAVDIQHYSSILCDATTNSLDSPLNIEDIINTLKKSRLKEKLLSVFAPLLEYEKNGMEALENNNIETVYEIIEKGSLYIFMHEPFDSISTGLHTALAETARLLEINRLDQSYDTMISRYYGGLYFSYEQALNLDIIAHYIFEQSGLIKTKMLAALLSTTSEIVNTVGKQFAQPLKIRDSNGQYKISLKPKIEQDRCINVIDSFREWLLYYSQIESTGHTVKSLCMDYVEALDLLDPQTTKVIYADPPYTRYHYSRYYHVLETICLRDNPAITTTFPNGQGGISRAIYRAGRHQSPFCIKSQAENAFRILFEKASYKSIPLILSYSPFDASKAVTPRLRTIDQLLSMAREYYGQVKVVSPGAFTHSKLNSAEKNHEANHEAELLIVCQ